MTRSVRLKPLDRSVRVRHVPTYAPDAFVVEDASPGLTAPLLFSLARDAGDPPPLLFLTNLTDPTA